MFVPIYADTTQHCKISLSENLLLTSNVYPECITVVCVVDWVSSASSAPVLTSIRETNWADGVDVGDGLLLRVLCVFGPVKRPSSRLMEVTVQSHCVSCQCSSFMVWGDCRFDFYCWWRTKFSWENLDFQLDVIQKCNFHTGLMFNKTDSLINSLWDTPE